MPTTFTTGMACSKESQRSFRRSRGPDFKKCGLPRSGPRALKSLGRADEFPDITQMPAGTVPELCVDPVIFWSDAKKEKKKGCSASV